MKNFINRTFEITGAVFISALFCIATYGIAMAIFYGFIINI